jgi:WD40 repeat protein
MSAEQLEQAATRPSRLQKNVAAGTVKRLTIRRVTLEDSRVVCICLIPGGRWMLSGSLEGSLSCWDLNVRPGQTSLSRVAEISFPCPSLHICAQAFSGDSAIVLLRTQGSVQRGQCIGAPCCESLT